MTQKIKIKRIDQYNNEVIFQSLEEAVIGTPKTSKPNISKCINGTLKKHGGYKWEKVESNENLPNEIWKEYSNFPDTEVSNLGRVRVNGVLRKVIKEKRCNNVFIYLDKLVLLWKIVASIWLPDQFNYKSRKCEFLDGNPENCNFTNLNLNPDIIPRQNTNEISEKTCIKCTTLLNINLFNENRNVCNSCRRQQQKNREITTKTCTNCNFVGNSNLFHGSKCNKCTWKQKVEMNKQRITDSISKPETCIKCKEPGEFGWRKDLQAFRNVCNKCINFKEYWKIYREKQKNIDLKSFLEHNAKIQREWRLANPQLVANSNHQRRTSANTRITQIINKAVKESVHVNEDQIMDMKELLLLPCTFCNYLDLEVKTNTLVMVNKTLGLTLDNVVTSCTVCATMKWINSIDYFLKNVFDIVAYRNLDINNLPKSRLLPDSKWTNNGHTGTHDTNKKTKIISDNYIKELKKNTCYLCGKTLSGGIDRINSDINYIETNVEPCCSDCNYLKKDMVLDEFFNHLLHIFKHSSTKSFDIIKNASEFYSKDWANSQKEPKFILTEFFENALTLDTSNEKQKVKPPRFKHIEHSQHFPVLVYNETNQIVASYPSMKECSVAMYYNYINLMKNIKEKDGFVCQKKYKLVTEKNIEKWKEMSKNVTEHSQKIFERDAAKYGKQKFSL